MSSASELVPARFVASSMLGSWAEAVRTKAGAAPRRRSDTISETSVLAPNPGMMTGPGANTYLVTHDEWS